MAQEVCQAIGLKNCHPEHLRGEDEKDKYEFVVSRAVMPLPDLVKLVRKNISNKHHNAMPNGVIVLKGGELQAETAPFGKHVEVIPCSTFFREEWFQTKQVIYLPL